MKKLVLIACLVITSQSFASHPHDVVCAVVAKTKSKETINLLLQMQSEREYVDGDPNKDIHDYTYQARICDDDNDLSASACSTFETLVPTHSITETFELVSMVNKKDVFFTGKINKNTLSGKIRTKDFVDGTPVVKYEAINGKINCINQTWVKLLAEADSNAH